MGNARSRVILRPKNIDGVNVYYARDEIGTDLAIRQSNAAE